MAESMPEICEHLRPVLTYVLSTGAKVTFAGQAWSRNCRQWVYVTGVLDLADLRRRFPLPEFVHDHEHRGTHDGSERGLVCELCQDAVMGALPSSAP
jgi:hypothetical protein